MTSDDSRTIMPIRYESMKRIDQRLELYLGPASYRSGSSAGLGRRKSYVNA